MRNNKMTVWATGLLAGSLAAASGMVLADAQPLPPTDLMPLAVQTIPAAIDQQGATGSAESLEQQWAEHWETIQPPNGSLSVALAGTQVHRLRHNPRLWILEFPDLRIQGAALNRVAALIERQAASKERILTETEMTELITQSNQGDAEHFFLGHDYRLDDLARFFSLAQRDGVMLNPAEQGLLTLLRGLALMEPSASGAWQIEGPELAVVTLAAASATPSPHHVSPFERLATLRHELSHGEYFTNPHYRAYCQRFWTARSESERTAIVRGLTQLGYDPASPDLMANELQAFLWEPQAGGWIDLWLRKVGGSLIALRETFLAGLDQAGEPISTLFTVTTMRRILIVPHDDWGAAMRVWSIAKNTEHPQ